LGVKNLVVVPKAMGQGGKKQKTDKRDAGELCDSLDRYLRGHDKALSVVRVPTQEQEQKRALIRYHRQIMADRGRCEARGKGLLCAQGIEVQGLWWEGHGWLEVQSDPQLKDWCAAPRFFVGTGQVQRRIISWELARGVLGNLTREELWKLSRLNREGQ